MLCKQGAAAGYDCRNYKIRSITSAPRMHALFPYAVRTLHKLPNPACCSAHTSSGTQPSMLTV